MSDDYGCSCPYCGKRMVAQRDVPGVEYEEWEFRCPEHGWINEYDVAWDE